MTTDLPHASGSRGRAWLSIVGIGADGEQGLAPRARSAIIESELVIGSARQLSLVAPLIRAEQATWPTPFSAGVTRVLERRGRSTCVLASGDPFFYGVGATLAPHLVPGEFVCHPAPSSLSLAAARLAWPLQDTDVVSLHGRDLHEVVRFLVPGRRVLALSWDRETPAALAALLVARGFGPTRLSVLEALGGPEERVREARASDFDLVGIADLNIVGVSLAAEPGARVLPVRSGLPDALFENDGQLTKREVRAITLSALGPRPGEVLWDVGAGAGSIAIEWMLAHPACVAVAIEREGLRCERIRRNARELGVPKLEVVHAEAPAGLSGLKAPDAVFIGGGASDRELVESCWQALGSGGRLVVNAVALETQACLLELHARRGGELCRIAIDVATPLGEMTCLRPAIAVLQWRGTKS